MYVIVTYARSDMKGVQARGIRVADRLGRENVVFYDSGDHSWLEKEGFKYREFNFNSFESSENIDFPQNTKAVIFADLPSNRPLQTSILLSARSKHLPVVVLENLYRKNQYQEGVYRNTIDFCDLMIFNGLDYLWPEKKIERVAFVPPLIPEKKDFSTSKKIVEEKIGSKLPENILVSVGYNEKVMDIVKKIASQYKDRKDIVFLAVGALEEGRESQIEGNIIYLPKQDEEEMGEFLSIAKIVFAKPGFLQVQETLAYNLPLFTLGKDTGFQHSWIDKKTLEVITHFDEFSQDITRRVDEVINPGRGLEELAHKLKGIHSGELDGAGKIAQIIMQGVEVAKKKVKASVLLCLDKKEERKVAKRIIEDNPFILPIFISAKFFTGEEDGNLEKFRVENKNEILQQSFSLICDFGWEATHSLSKIFPFYNRFILALKMIIESSDEIILIGEETMSFIKPLLPNKGSGIAKVIKDPSFIYNKRGK